jgi:hypothetical protein
MALLLVRHGDGRMSFQSNGVILMTKIYDDMYNEHEYVVVVPPGDTEKWPIDVAVLPILSDLWSNGILTRASCQGGPCEYVDEDMEGYIYFDDSVKDLRPAIAIMKRNGLKNLRVKRLDGGIMGKFTESPRGRVAKSPNFTRWLVTFDSIGLDGNN